MDVDCQLSGSLHDGKIFVNSKVYQDMSIFKFSVTYYTLLPGRMQVPDYLIVDPAYPLTPYCTKNTPVALQMSKLSSATLCSQQEIKLNVHLATLLHGYQS